MDEDKSKPFRLVTPPERNAKGTDIAADDVDDDETPDEDVEALTDADDAEKAEDEYVEELAEDLDGLYGRAGKVGRNALKTSTGTVVSQLLTLRLIDAVEALGEKLDKVAELLEAQDERARALADALDAAAPAPPAAGG